MVPKICLKVRTRNSEAQRHIITYFKPDTHKNNCYIFLGLGVARARVT